jgi:hypothetical protein
VWEQKGALLGSAILWKTCDYDRKQCLPPTWELKSLARIKIEEMNPLYSKNGTCATGASRDRLHFHLYMGP